MSLQVWLPLNGNLNNQGLTNFTPTINTNPTWTDNGKIGKAMVLGSIYMPAEATQQILNNQEFSFACWIYVAASSGNATDRGMLFGNSGMSANNNRKFSIFQYPTCNDLHLSWQNDEANVTYAGGVWNGVFPSGKWTHLAIAYKNPSGKIYLNGTYYASFSGISNSSSFAYDTRLFENCPNNGRYLNDYRIYDHCLSDKEVEEIAKGLVLHYKLDNDNNANYGWLLPNNERTITRSSGNTFIDYEYFPDLILNTETNYIVDFDAKGSVPDMGLDLYFRNSNGSGYAVVQKQTLTTEYQHYSLELVGSPDTLQLFRARCYGGTAGDIIYLKNVKLLSNNMPIRNNIIYDSSGYNNNGIIIGQIETSNSTPKYSICTYINSPDPTTNSSTGEYYISANCELTTPSTISIAWWANPESGYGGGISHAMWCTTANNIASDYTTSAFNHRDTRFDVNSSDDQHLALSTSSFVANAWHHYVVTYNGQTAKLYKDGVQQTSVAFTAAKTLGTFTKILIGHSRAGGVHRKMKGKYSDFRVYATCLTQEQILELYHTSASIDKNGNIYTRELVEM